MTTMFQRSTLYGAVLAGLLIAGCAPNKQPAEMAIADANTTLKKASDDGQKYAPEQYAIVSEQVVAMRAAFDKQDYNSVLNMVSKLGTSLRSLGEAISNKKADARVALRDLWSGLSRDVPKSLLDVESKVADLKKAHRLPKGVTRDAFAGLGAKIDAAKQGWGDAQSAQTAGNLEDAVAKGKAAATQISELRTSLGMGTGSAAAK